MCVGISTASFYPMHTEDALKLLGESGVKLTEIFFNSSSEIEPEFIKTLKQIKDDYGMKITAVHPFTSLVEPYLLFSEYKRRFIDGAEFYKKYFEAAAVLEAKFAVIHGDYIYSPLSIDEYCERYALLAEYARSYGITLTQENVNKYKSANPEFLKSMKAVLKDDVKFTLDIKQSVRSGFTPFQLLDAMGESVVHIHVSDNNQKNDCLLPGKGCFDFKTFQSKAKLYGFSGSYIIEVYKNAYNSLSQLIGSYGHLKTILM